MYKIAHIFIALLLDILAFTLILPLFPKLIENYHQLHLEGKDEFYSAFLSIITGWWNFIKSGNGNADLMDESGNGGKRIDIVLVGGALGSLFALLQFFSSPVIGRLSDRYGRKSILLVTMIGNILSALFWMFSRNFIYFVLARVIGGLSEGNVQLSISMITDLTTEETRSKGLALVGIAFAVGFTFGPAIGAYFASIDLSQIFPQLEILGMNTFSAAAFFSLLILVAETIYIAIFIPETYDQDSSSSSSKGKSVKKSPPNTENQTSRFYILISAFLYLFFFSGMEFTLTFLTFERFRYTNMQQGKLLGFIGVLSSLIQGGYVHKMAYKIGEDSIVKQGLVLCTISCLGLAVVGTPLDPLSDFSNLFDFTLTITSLCFSFASATVVNGLTALYSMTLGSGFDERKGEMMANLRSVGQLGRSLGPIALCSIYWLLGSATCYLICATGIFTIFILTLTQVQLKRSPSENTVLHEKKRK